MPGATATGIGAEIEEITRVSGSLPDLSHATLFSRIRVRRADEFFIFRDQVDDAFFRYQSNI